MTCKPKIIMSFGACQPSAGQTCPARCERSHGGTIERKRGGCIIQRNMEQRPNSSFLPYLASAITLFLIGWGTAAFAVLGLTPTLWARWLLFFGCTLGLTSLALPATWFLNLRFPSDPPAAAYVIVRQAIWVGVYGAVLVWLQQERLVTIWTGLGLALGLIAIEYFVRMREKARWQPKPLPEEPSGAESTPPTEE
jgi:hypothetical protein